MDHYLQELNFGGRRTSGEGQDQRMVLIGDVGSAEKEPGGGSGGVRQRAAMLPTVPAPTQSAVPPKVYGISHWPVGLGVLATFPWELQVLSDPMWD